jgi:cysteine desulfuration protein SufE
MLKKIENVLRDFINTNENERYKFLINLGRTLPQMPKDLKIDKYKINGCQSEVWVYPEYKDGKLFFTIDGEAAIIKGILLLINKIYSGATTDEILSIDENFLTESGLIANLSMTRSNGIAQVVKQIKMYAMAFKAMGK